MKKLIVAALVMASFVAHATVEEQFKELNDNLPPTEAAGYKAIARAYEVACIKGKQGTWSSLYVAQYKEKAQYTKYMVELWKFMDDGSVVGQKMRKHHIDGSCKIFAQDYVERLHHEIKIAGENPPFNIRYNPDDAD